jgi:molybdenum cofactor cytidylyltransferase
MTAPKNYPISLIVLAAGTSSRMTAEIGTNKLFLTTPDGVTLLETTLHIYTTLPFLEILLVLPPVLSSTFAFNIPPIPRLKTLINTENASGMASSLVLGIKNTSETSTGYMIALADMPLVQPSTIEALCRLFSEKNSPYALCIPTVHTKRGNPVMFGAAYRQELMELSGDIGAKSVVQRHTEHICTVETADEGIVLDIDTLEDWENFLLRQSRSKNMKPTL